MKKAAMFILMVVCLVALNASAFAAEVSFDGNGGTFEYKFEDVGVRQITNTRGNVANGATVSTLETDFQITNPVYWDGERVFLGWDVLNIVPPAQAGPPTVTTLSANPIPTSDVGAFVVPNNLQGFLQFFAVWAGDDEDYYVDITIDGFNEDVTYTETYGGGETNTFAEKEKVFYNVKKGLGTVASGISEAWGGLGITLDSITKANATLEGWLEVNSLSGSAAFVSVTPISTSDMLAKDTPSCDTVFVAKWSDISMADYYTYFQITPPADPTPTPETTQQVVVGTLTTPPAAVAEKHPTVADIEFALTDAAEKTGLLDRGAKSELMDVSLQYKNADGDWETVTFENFPAEGVETVLPYPQGTNQDNFEFVVAHMISAGPKAGEVEILESVLKEDGIHVRFTSMSPVMIMYQEKTESEMPLETNSPQTGNGNHILLLSSVCLASAVMFVFLTVKKKAIRG